MHVSILMPFSIQTIPLFRLIINFKIYLTDPYMSQILVRVHNDMLLIYTKQPARLLLRRRVFLELGESE